MGLTSADKITGDAIKRDQVGDGKRRIKHTSVVSMYAGVKRYTRLNTEAIIIPCSHRKVDTFEDGPFDGSFVVLTTAIV